MVNLVNYFEKLDSIGVETLPPTLLKSHDFLIKATDHGKDWDRYESNASIKNALDLYIAKLNEYLSSQGTNEKESEKKRYLLVKRRYPKNVPTYRQRRLSHAQRQARTTVKKATPFLCGLNILARK